MFWLQKILITSQASKLKAVKRVTQDSRGTRTAKIDGMKALPPKKRLELVNILTLSNKASPIKKVYIPKNKKKVRPLSIPTITDRAKQFLVLMALEPQWEAIFEPNSYSFRPGRSCHNTIKAIL